MKKVLLALLGLAFCSTFVPAKEPSKPTNFSGNWALDFGQIKNLPTGLEGCSLVVSQDQQQLKVETLLQSNPQANPIVPNGGAYPGGSSRGSSGGGRGAPGGGSGMPGGGDGWPRVDGASPGKVAAYRLYPHSAIYKLDGSESTAQLGDTGKTAAVSKAEWAKDGEVLKLSLIGNEDPGHKGGKIEVKDQWRFSADGTCLMIDRNIKSPEGSGTVRLFFFRKEVGPSSGAAPTTQKSK